MHPAKAQFLAEAWESVAGQEMPPGWDRQWVVQEDGTDAELANRMPDDKRVTYAAGRAGGPAVARTISLARADGDLVKVLDADDVLAPALSAATSRFSPRIRTWAGQRHAPRTCCRAAPSIRTAATLSPAGSSKAPS